MMENPPVHGPGAKVLILARVSSDGQDWKAQIPQLNQVMLDNGWVPWLVVTEKEHGDAPGRSALNEIKHYAHQHLFKVLLVWAVDRLTRGGIEAMFDLFNYFEPKGVQVYSFCEPYLSTADPSSRPLLLAIAAWKAAEELKRLRKRTSAKMQQLKALGVHVGRPVGSKDKKPRVKRGTPGNGFGISGGK